MLLNERLAYTLGVSIGENIFHTSLVTLNDDETNSSLSINMDDNDYKVIKNYQSRLFKLIDKNKDFNDLHKEFVKVRKEMVNKYLPKTLRCPIVKILPIDDEIIYPLKKGIQHFLWNCDVCEYSIENVDDMILEEGEFDYDFLILKLR